MRPHVLVLLLGSALSIGATSCGASKTDAQTAAENRQQQIASVQAHLSGSSWRLVGYAPDVPLEPMFAVWFESAKQSMTVRFLSDHIVVDAPPNVRFDHKYKIEEARGEHFTLTTQSDTGARYSMSGRIIDDGRKIEFHVETAPFRGSGMLQRI